MHLEEMVDLEEVVVVVTTAEVVETTETMVFKKWKKNYELCLYIKKSTLLHTEHCLGYARESNDRHLDKT